MIGQYHSNVVKKRLSVIDLTALIEQEIIPEYIQKVVSLGLLKDKNCQQSQLDSLMTKVGIGIVDSYIQRKKFVMFERVLLFLPEQISIDLLAFDVSQISKEELYESLYVFVRICKGIYQNRILQLSIPFDEYIKQLNGDGCPATDILINNREAKASKAGKKLLLKKCPRTYGEIFSFS